MQWNFIYICYMIIVAKVKKLKDGRYAVSHPDYGRVAEDTEFEAKLSFMRNPSLGGIIVKFEKD